MTQIFRTRLAFSEPQCNLVRRPVIGHHSGMVDGNVSGTLIEIDYRIATGLHSRRYEFIGFRD